MHENLTKIVDNGKVCVTFLSNGYVRHEMVGTLLNVVAHDLAHDQHIGYLFPMRAGGVMDIYRNLAVEQFMGTDCEWLLFVDSDQVLPHDFVDKMLSVAAVDRVVCGLYPMALDEGVRPNIFFRRKNEHNDDIPMRPAEWADVPEDDLIYCDGTGAGALIIHRSLLVAMFHVYGAAAPWFAVETFDGVRYGEDFTFDMRVAQMGCKVAVYTGIEIGHVKTQILQNVTYRPSALNDKESAS